MNVPKTNATNGTADAEDDDKALGSLGRILGCLWRHLFDWEERSQEEIEKENDLWQKFSLSGAWHTGHGVCRRGRIDSWRNGFNLERTCGSCVVSRKGERA